MYRIYIKCLNKNILLLCYILVIHIRFSLNNNLNHIIYILKVDRLIEFTS